jgi:hypothetical protein
MQWKRRYGSDHAVISGGLLGAAAKYIWERGGRVPFTDGQRRCLENHHLAAHEKRQRNKAWMLELLRAVESASKSPVIPRRRRRPY